MNKEAFKQRMQSLKSYREQNPGKGYWDFKSYEEGGEVPPTNKPTIIEPIPYKGKLYSDRYGRKYTEEQVYDYYNNGTDEIDRFTGGPLVRGLKPLLDLEDAANFTPVGDAVAAYDVYDAVSNRDWSGAGLAALGLVPFMPIFDLSKDTEFSPNLSETEINSLKDPDLFTKKELLAMVNTLLIEKLSKEMEEDERLNRHGNDNATVSDTELQGWRDTHKEKEQGKIQCPKEENR